MSPQKTAFNMRCISFSFLLRPSSFRHEQAVGGVLPRLKTENKAIPKTTTASNLFQGSFINRWNVVALILTASSIVNRNAKLQQPVDHACDQQLRTAVCPHCNWHGTTRAALLAYQRPEGIRGNRRINTCVQKYLKSRHIRLSCRNKA